MLLMEEHVNSTTGYFMCGASEPYESFTDNIKKLFQRLQREYGGCVSKIYVDSKNDKPRSIGWVFSKKDTYEDTKESFVHETWITLLRKQPKKTVKQYYKYI